ncbi:MAG: S26 family signal peptidase [Victivallaceae bacterium]|nr:S26 family signal peptidase [Victivallaceae bacterium]
MKELIYTGCSMLGVFTPGDMLLAEPVEFSRVAPGDIVVFASPPTPEKLLVHRAVSVSCGTIRTHGDNNLRPDPVALASNAQLLKVIAVKRAGAQLKVTSGRCGMTEFRRNQRRVRIRCAAARLAHPLAALAPLRFLAPRKDLLELRNFVRDGKPLKSMLFYHDRQVAVYDFSRRVWRPLGRWKLFFTAGRLSCFVPPRPTDGEPRP